MGYLTTERPEATPCVGLVAVQVSCRGSSFKADAVVQLHLDDIAGPPR